MMGGAKRMQMEADERGYDLNDSTYVCSRCFHDRGIRKFVQKNASLQQCSYCRRAGSSVKACKLDLVIGHVLESLRREWGDPTNEGLPYETREGGWQGKVYSTFDLLDDYLEVREGKILDDICRAIHQADWCERDPYSLPLHGTLTYGWEMFCSFVKKRSRYVFFDAPNPDYDPDQHDEMNPVDILEYLGSIANDMKLVQTISSSTDIFRVRIIDKGQSLSSAKELGAPPDDFATIPNRMSPAGISMFYGAFDIKTAVRETYEVRRKKQTAACGIFRPVRNLKVIDLTKVRGVPSLFDEVGYKKRPHAKFFRSFISDFTKPVDRKDRSHIDYVPTQIVTEYFRHIFKMKSGRSVDGIIYPSAKPGGEKAVVIFAESRQCVECNDRNAPDALLWLKAVDIFNPKNYV